MRPLFSGLIGFWLILTSFLQPAISQPVEPRIAFVVGNAAYQAGPLENALDDAGLVAESLRSIGFEIVEGADLSSNDLMRSYRDFLQKVQAGGPETIAFVYFSGYGMEFEGENFLIGANARIEREGDVPLEGVRLSDLLRPLSDMQTNAKIVVIDASRPLPFKIQGRDASPGLAGVEAYPGMLVAYAAPPGTTAPDRPGEYGPYATAIAEMVRAPGLDLDGMFTRIRSRVHQLTEGQQTPWHVADLGETIVLLPADSQPTSTASVPDNPPPEQPRIYRETRPMRELNPDEAYAVAIEGDTLEGYTEFVEAYPRHAYTPRVYAIIRARREALAWLRASEINTPESYWTYLQRYPNGIYAHSAERRLRRLSALAAPPPGFAPVEFEDVPPPLPEEPVEYVYIERGPPPPRILIAPQPVFFINLGRPYRGPGFRRGPRLLPAAVQIPRLQRIAPAVRRPGRTFVNVSPRQADPASEPRWRRRQMEGPRVRPAGPRPGAPARPATTTPPPGRPGVRPPVATAPTTPAIRPGTPTTPAVRPGTPPPTATAPTTPAVRPGTPPAGATRATPGTRPGARPSTATAPTTPPTTPPTRPATTPPSAATTPATPGARPAIDPRRTPPGPPPRTVTAPTTGPAAPALRPSGPPPRAAPPPPRPATAPAARPVPPTAARPPAPPPPTRAAPPPPAARAAPPPPVVRAPPPAARAAPPPAARPAPPAAAARVAPPPAARPAPAAPAKKPPPCPPNRPNCR